MGGIIISGNDCNKMVVNKNGNKIGNSNNNKEN